MDPIQTAAATGLQARIDALDTLANNLANTGSSGFKADREFYGSYLSPQLSGEADPIVGETPYTKRHWTDFSQGSLSLTGNSTDLALTGEGFFSVSGPSGTLYTRNGNFHLDKQGVLVTNENFPVRAVGGGKITLSPTADFSVGTDGSVVQSGVAVGQLQLADFSNSGQLTKTANNYFQVSDPAVTPDKLATAEVQQGRVESSNTSPAESAARMMTLMRSFEMLQHAIKLGTDMNRQSIEEIARVV